MRRFIPWFAGMVAVCCLAIYAGSRHPGLPYNVREMFPPGAWFRGGLFLAVLLYVALGSPMLVACLMVSRNPAPKGSFLAFVTIQSCLASILVVQGAPVESVHDLVGSPTLGWPDSMELVCRLAAFLTAPFAVLNGAALLAVAGVRRFACWETLGSIALAATVWYLVVVQWANTDNITELLPNGGRSLRLLALGVWLFLFGWAMSLPATVAGSKRLHFFILCVLVTITTLPLGWMLLTVGTESRVVKYGKTFSALQFLLSANRQRLVSGIHLFLRYGIAHAIMMLLGLLCQISLWRLFCSTESIAFAQKP